jgi:hypothetical protein
MQLLLDLNLVATAEVSRVSIMPIVPIMPGFWRIPMPTV